MYEPADIKSQNNTPLIKFSEGMHASTASLYIKAYSPSSERQFCGFPHMRVDSNNGAGINELHLLAFVVILKRTSKI